MDTLERGVSVRCVSVSDLRCGTCIVPHVVDRPTNVIACGSEVVVRGSNGPNVGDSDRLGSPGLGRVSAVLPQRKGGRTHACGYQLFVSAASYRLGIQSVIVHSQFRTDSVHIDR